MKAVVAAFNQEKALVGAFSVITNLRMELFGGLVLAAGCWLVLMRATMAGSRVNGAWSRLCVLCPGHQLLTLLPSVKQHVFLCPYFYLLPDTEDVYVSINLCKSHIISTYLLSTSR